MLIFAVVFINLALIFYTTGVWIERKQACLSFLNVIIFWIGLLFDILGTIMMFILSNAGIEFNFHGITGIIGIILMLLHSIWATKVLVENQGEMKFRFHKFSIIVWLIWLIPFFSGAILGMKK